MMARHITEYPAQRGRIAFDELSPFTQKHSANGSAIADFEKPHPDLHGQDLARRGIRYEDVKLKRRA